MKDIRGNTGADDAPLPEGEAFGRRSDGGRASGRRALLRPPGSLVRSLQGTTGLLPLSSKRAGRLRGGRPEATRHDAALYGTVREEKEGLWVLALEDITGLALLNSTDEPGRWSREPIEAAIRGLAKIHSAWYGRESDLRSQDWLGPVTTSASLSEMGEFWKALAEHAHHYFRRFAGEAAVAMQARCLDDLDQWSRGLDGLPRTLIHNDFNPRNLAFRRGNGAGLKLCAYDWELATLGVPQHDLAELLCFVLSPHATTEELEHYVELHRRSLENETGAPIDARDWRRGFALSLEHLIVNRFPMYTLVCRFQRKRFLERVVPTWLRLSRLGQDARNRSRVYPGEVGTGSPRSVDEPL